jgi:hypothetical protein
MTSTKSVTEHPCAFCVKGDIDPPASGSLIQGVKYNDWEQRTRAWRGYCCDMHLENFQSYRFL